MNRYRFYQVPNGEKLYLAADWETMTADKKQAGLFHQKAWDQWGLFDFEREEIAEDEVMRLIGAPTLPGIEPATPTVAEG